MQQYGGFTLKMGSEEQAQAVKSIVLEYCTEEWSEGLTVIGDTLHVDTDTHIYMWDYPNTVLSFCKEIAEKHPDFSFMVDAQGGDDEGFNRYYEHGTFKDGVFNYTQQSEEPDEEGGDWDESEEDFDEWLERSISKLTTTTGNLINGVMQFSETVEIVHEEDEDEEDFENFPW